MENAINGIIPINKPQGWTSFDVVAKLRGFFHTRQIGHAGTLDPLATGVLLVCIGNATKISNYLMVGEKEYEAVLQLGVVTDTQDATGKIIGGTPFNGTIDDVKEVAKTFLGKTEQIPPMFSAIKIGGKKLYEIARKGEEVPRAPRTIQIFSISVHPMAENNEFRLKIRCSHGTYIRTICHDIGAKLGCGGTMKALVRTENAGISLAECYELEDIGKVIPTEKFKHEAIAIGKFDGVHIAHKKLLEEITKDISLRPTVLVIDNDKNVLTSDDEKRHIFKKFGVKNVKIMPLDEVKNLTPRQFFEKYLSAAKKIAVGYNFHFGKNREGNVDTLRSLCEKNGAELFVLPEIIVNGETVSSTLIKKRKLEGKSIKEFF